MARKVFFSFHYDDVGNFKVNNVRNSWVTHDKKKRNTFDDSSIWEDAKLKGDKAIKKLIDETGLKNSSVTAVLIGSGTFERRWVRYEIVKSFVRGNGITAIHLNKLKGKEGKISAKGKNPLDQLRIYIDEKGEYIYFQELINGKWKTYEDFQIVANNKSNTKFFEKHFWGTNPYWGSYIKLSELFQTYRWVKDDGYNNFPKWVEEAYNASSKNTDGSSWSFF